MEKSLAFDLPIYGQQDLCLNAFGHSYTAPRHKYGPAVRPYYLIHFIVGGKGKFWAENTCYQLSAGQGFVIEPDYQTIYMADEEEPWEYAWVGFSGKSAKQIMDSLGLSHGQPIFKSNERDKMKDCVMNMLRHDHNRTEDTYYTIGMLYLLFSIIAASNRDALPRTDGNAYVNQALSYIQNHIAEPLQVDDIARYVGLNRSYFSSVFRENTGLTPLKYIQTFRLTKAKHLLESSTLPVAGIAFSCGYQRPESLMKIFRQQYGISPAAYRKQIIERNSLASHRV